VLVMDDLQWADSGSLGLIEEVASDRSNRSLVVVCVYRSNEVESNPGFAAMLNRQEDENGPLITQRFAT
jgi:predicted ATPase